MRQDYEAMLEQALRRLAEVVRQTRELDVEEVKLTQFIKATLNLLPEKQQQAWKAALEELGEQAAAHMASLTAAIRAALRTHAPEWLTVAGVRDQLVGSGFDFSHYSSNPLASVSTTLRRLSDKDPLVDTKMMEGVAVYRWKQQRRKDQYVSLLDEAFRNKGN